METSQFSADIDALLHPMNNLLFSPRSSRSQGPMGYEPLMPAKQHLRRGRSQPLQEPTDNSEKKKSAAKRVTVVNGKDIGDLPTKYEVRGLRKNEFPVIGTFVHQNILPGFQYLVRKLDSERFLFKKKPLALQSIGCGYGKRITFQSELKNVNNNYFYSDTHIKGYGFSIVAVQPEDTFTVVDSEGRTVGEGVIKEVGIQQEMSSNVKKNGTIVKKVRVTFSCDVNYGSKQHGLMPLFREDTMELTGTAVISKDKRSRSAVTDCIEQIELPCLGPCTFQLD